MRRVVVRMIVPEQVETATAMPRRPGNGLCIAAVAMVVGLTVVRLVMCGAIELIPEETYYWTYAQHPALGYYDHPPMVAWFIMMGTALCGNTAMGVRIMTFALWVGTAGLLFLTGRMWFGQRAALLGTVMFTLVPVYVGAGLIVTPDAPLLFFWAATLYLISKALQTGRGGYWLAAGVTFGGALLSKYYALLLAPSLLWFLLLSPNHRHWLRRIEPWLALPIALAVFSPVIVWNSQHEWASFLFQSSRASGTQGHAWWTVLLFWGVQLGILMPPLFALFAWAAARGVGRGWLQHDDRWSFLASFSLPLFFLFAAASLKTEIHVNWTAPAFLSVLPGAAAITLDGLRAAEPTRARRWRWGAILTATLCGFVVALFHIGLAWGVPNPIASIPGIDRWPAVADMPKCFAYVRAGGWNAVAERVNILRTRVRNETKQEPFLIGMDKYDIAAELGFHLRAPDECVNPFATGGQGLGYRYWTDLRKFEGRPAVAVAPSPGASVMTQLRRRFERVAEPQLVEVPRCWGLNRQVYLIVCAGYHAVESPAPDPR
ncbi:MAG TPA: glycosyltransferase family 39 protein [Verrucomicrobiae bacterium]|nr:glycosyltransferase family 39 protein [Verrucomicrobiae bacterium]